MCHSHIHRKNPFVSIIIVTFNAAKTLRTALESVYKQTLQDWECIIVDGASKDNTIAIIKEYVDKDIRFRYISESDKGIYDAFNKGWRMAKGEWVMYLGSDDEYLYDGIEILLNDTECFDVVYGDIILKYSNGIERLQPSKPVNKLKRMIMPCCHQALAMRRNVIKEMGGFNETFRIIADKDLVCRCFFSNYKFKWIHVPVAKFYIGGVSQTSYKAVVESYKISKRYFNSLNALMFFAKSLFIKTSVLIKHYFENSFVSR